MSCSALHSTYIVRLCRRPPATPTLSRDYRDAARARRGGDCDGRSVYEAGGRRGTSITASRTWTTSSR
jgi:hypothetical protein